MRMSSIHNRTMFAARPFLRRSAAAAVAAGGLTALTRSTDCELKRVDFSAPSLGSSFVKGFFEKFQKDGEVDLSKALDLEHVKELLIACGSNAKDAKELFQAMDTDQDGFVDYAELIAYFAETMRGTDIEKAKFVFYACDVDASGTVEPDELKLILHHMMLLKKKQDGLSSFMQWHDILYRDIPETYVVHLKANEFVDDVFRTVLKSRTKKTTAALAGTSAEEGITEKEFVFWWNKGGKEVNRLHMLFGGQSAVERLIDRASQDSGSLSRKNSKPLF